MCYRKRLTRLIRLWLRREATHSRTKSDTQWPGEGTTDTQVGHFFSLRWLLICIKYFIIMLKCGFACAQISFATCNTWRKLILTWCRSLNLASRREECRWRRSKFPRQRPKMPSPSQLFGLMEVRKYGLKKISFIRFVLNTQVKIICN